VGRSGPWKRERGSTSGGRATRRCATSSARASSAAACQKPTQIQVAALMTEASAGLDGPRSMCPDRALISRDQGWRRSTCVTNPHVEGTRRRTALVDGENGMGTSSMGGARAAQIAAERRRAPASPGWAGAAASATTPAGIALCANGLAARHDRLYSRSGKRNHLPPWGAGRGGCAVAKRRRRGRYNVDAGQGQMRSNRAMTDGAGVVAEA